MKKFICMILYIIMIVTSTCSGDPTVTETEADTTAPETEEPGEVFVFDDGIKEDAGDSQTDIPEPAEHSYEQNFDKKLTAADKTWSINGEGTFTDGVFRSTEHHTYLDLKEKIKADVLDVEVDMKAVRAGTINNVAGYIGLRLPNSGEQYAAVGANGIWIAFHCKQIGIIDTWPNMKMFDCGVDFSETQRVLLTDDVRNNVITVSVLDNGEKKTLMTVKIGEDKKVIASDGKTYFLAVCAENITAPEGENWMNLFINADGDGKNGWYGCDLIVNRDNGSVEKFTDGWSTEKIGHGEVFVKDNYIVTALDDKT